jgi:replicative DNA helicase Mcm
LIKEFENRTEHKLPELDLLKKIVNSNIIWSKIKDIENLKKKNEEVYDLFIPSTNTFVSNGIGVHNSVMLKFITNIAPKGRYVSGKSASAAGMTASVIKDEFLKGWSLEAGAMVLCHKGLCAIDERGQMEEEDRSAMHEAMEQQTISISKANVQATLKCETSVLAAGNPKFGRFDLYQPLAQQINIDVALLTRFDLIFILKDLPERSKDEAIAAHVLNERRPDNVLPKNMIETQLFRKYLAYAKQNIQPELTDRAIEEIKRFYVDLRNQPSVSNDLVKPIPVTARQLEALIRLAEAHAKARLSQKITKDDALRAIEILKFCLMQIGFDYETKQFDIDKLSTGITASKKNKILIVKEAIVRLESRLGKLIPIEELSKELADKVDKDIVEEIVEQLAIAGDIFKPKRGFIQRM